MVSDSRPATLRPEGRPQTGLPPHDVSAEEAVIAALLLDDDTYARVVPILLSTDFFREQNRWCYEAALELAERGEPITVPTLAHELDRAGQLDAAGGEPYLTEVASKYFTAVGVEAHARIVARDALYRRLINAAGEIARLAYEGGPEQRKVIARSEELLLGIQSAQGESDFKRLRDLLDDFLESPGEEADGLDAGVRSGFMDLDHVLTGFKRGDLIIVAARTGVGKTALMLKFSRNAAVGEKGTVAHFSLEMSGDQLAMRLLASESGVPVGRLRIGGHRDDEERQVMNAIGQLSDTKLYIDDSASLSVPEIRAKCRRLQADVGLDLVVIDYLQLLNNAGRADTRAGEVGAISRGLKELARELNVPVIAAAQLSRAVESRQPHIPMLSDLRESGSIEQDADVVMFIYREDVYQTAEQWQDQNPTEPGGQHPTGLAQLIIAKHRNGPTDTISVRWRAQLATFEDLVLREPVEMPEFHE